MRFAGEANAEGRLRILHHGDFKCTLSIVSGAITAPLSSAEGRPGCPQAIASAALAFPDRARLLYLDSLRSRIRA